VAEQHLVKHALALAKDYPDGLDGCERGNSLIGSIMSMAPPVGFGSPRWATEAACREAKRRLANGKEG
jgi:hypothetical protein